MRQMRTFPDGILLLMLIVYSAAFEKVLPRIASLKVAF